MIADDMTLRQLVADFPQLTAEDVKEALRFASARVAEREIDLPRGA